MGRAGEVGPLGRWAHVAGQQRATGSGSSPSGLAQATAAATGGFRRGSGDGVAGEAWIRPRRSRSRRREGRRSSRAATRRARAPSRASMAAGASCPGEEDGRRGGAQRGRRPGAAAVVYGGAARRRQAARRPEGRRREADGARARVREEELLQERELGLGFLRLVTWRARVRPI